MKFSEMTYTRPDVDAIRREYEQLAAAIEGAASPEEQIAAFERYNAIFGELDTMTNLSYIRHTIDTRDEFYDKENDFIDEHMPLLEAARAKVRRALLAAKFRPALEKRFGSLLFTDMEIAERCFTPAMVGLMQRENRLVSEYDKLYASAMADFDGKTMPLPQLEPHMQSLDRAVRKGAYEAQGRFFDAHREELDRIFDELVKNRTEQAKLLGHESFLRLGYDRLGRNCYGPDEVKALREQIARDIVPLVTKVKKSQEKRLGLDRLMFWDNALLFPDGSPAPQGTADDVLAAGREMYRRLSPEMSAFADCLYGGELLDVLSKEGKAPGGYCTAIYGYKAPFIFSNFNGTSGDVDVLTHEAGHAFEAWRAMEHGCLPQQVWPTPDACECHSMSMEFLTAPYHSLFFGDATAKYELGHCEGALTFLPYGCMVDEFQHIMYENPTLDPGQRNGVWLDLEKKYRPWADFGDLPFYSRGALWQRQLHIYTSPFYYIDYCMAQTVAFQFWLLSLEDREDAWARYLAFVDKGGTQTFEQLVRGAGLRVPYEEGAIRSIGGAVSRWIDAHPAL